MATDASEYITRQRPLRNATLRRRTRASGGAARYAYTTRFFSLPAEGLGLCPTAGAPGNNEGVPRGGPASNTNLCAPVTRAPSLNAVHTWQCGVQSYSATPDLLTKKAPNSMAQGRLSECFSPEAPPELIRVSSPPSVGLAANCCRQLHGWRPPLTFRPPSSGLPALALLLASRRFSGEQIYRGTHASWRARTHPAERAQLRWAGGSESSSESGNPTMPDTTSSKA